MLINMAESNSMKSSKRGEANVSSGFLDAIAWNTEGLVPVITQDADSGQVLMLAWMNREALARTVERGEAVYWSRSRKRLWHKGETSGHVQIVEDIRLDCDGDALPLRVRPQGGLACHTARPRCFYRRSENSLWQSVEPVLKPPEAIYGK